FIGACVSLLLLELLLFQVGGDLVSLAFGLLFHFSHLFLRVCLCFRVGSIRGLSSLLGVRQLLVHRCATFLQVLLGMPLSFVLQRFLVSRYPRCLFLIG